MSKANRRRHERMLGRGLASHVRSSGTALPGVSVENISLGGLFLRTNAPLPMNTPLEVELVRRGLKRAIVLTGKVVNLVSPPVAHARGTVPGLGVRFDPLAPEIEVRLRELLEAISGKPLPAPTPAPGAGGFVERESWRTARPAAHSTTTPARAPIPLAPEDFEPGAMFGAEHFGADTVVPVAEDTFEHTRVSALEDELARTRAAFDQAQQVIQALRATVEAMRAELLRKEQENAELTRALENVRR